MIFYSAHNGKSMYYRVSERPEDISEWGKGNAYAYTIHIYIFKFLFVVSYINIFFLQNLKSISIVKESKVIHILTPCY